MIQQYSLLFFKQRMKNSFGSNSWEWSLVLASFCEYYLSCMENSQETEEKFSWIKESLDVENDLLRLNRSPKLFLVLRKIFWKFNSARSMSFQKFSDELYFPIGDFGIMPKLSLIHENFSLVSRGFSGTESWRL